MPTKLNRVTVNLTDAQVASLPSGRSLAHRVLLALGYDLPKRGPAPKPVNAKEDKSPATGAKP